MSEDPVGSLARRAAVRPHGCLGGRRPRPRSAGGRPLQPADDPGGRAPEPGRDVADVPVLRDGGPGRRLAPGPPGQPGGRRRGAGDGRGHGRDARRADHAPATWGSGPTRTSSRWPGSPGSSTAGGRRRHPARPRRPQGELRPAVEGRRPPEDARGRGLDGRRAQPDPVQRRRPAPGPARRGRDRRRSSPPSRPPRSGRSTPGSASSRSTRPTATCCTSSSRRSEQPSRRRVRRQPGEPDAAGAPRRRDGSAR